MKIKVQDVTQEGQHVSFKVDPLHWEQVASDLALLGEIQAELDVFSQGDPDEGVVYVSSAVSVKVECECSRCLKLFPQSVSSDFHLLYTPTPDSLPGGEHALSSDALDLHYYEGDQIDVDSELVSQLVLSIPMLPLCQDDCRGLCPHCGENLNLVTCLCPSEAVSPTTWAALKNFSNKESHAESKT